MFKVIVVLMSTAPFVAGVAAILLDNTIPGTRQERGLTSWASTTEFKVFEISLIKLKLG